MTTTALPEDIMILYVQLVAYSRNRKDFQMRIVQKNKLVAKYNLYVEEQKQMRDVGRKETLLTLSTDDEKPSFMSTNLKWHYKHFYGCRPIF
jgi:hypothetical protein